MYKCFGVEKSVFPDQKNPSVNVTLFHLFLGTPVDEKYGKGFKTQDVWLNQESMSRLLPGIDPIQLFNQTLKISRGLGEKARIESIEIVPSK